MKIAVCETHESGANLFVATMQEILTKYELNNAVEVIKIDPAKIQSDLLLQDEYLGLILPGRNRGQDYRDEINKKGFRSLRKAVTQGMAIQATCAGSSILTKETIWKNALQPDYRKHVHNPYGLFNGTAVGPFNDLWHDGYRHDVQVPDAYHSNVLAAKVASITYSRELTGTPEHLNGHGIYWGGCAFKPARDNAQNIVTLAWYNQNIEVPGRNMPASPEHGKDTPYLFTNAAAVIEFDVGDAKVMFFNSHPEISADIFNNRFVHTPQARKNPEQFQQDHDNLKVAAPLNFALMERYLANCMTSPKVSHLVNLGLNAVTIEAIENLKTQQRFNRRTLNQALQNCA